MGRLTEQNRRELAEQGYTIVPAVIDEALAARARNLMDQLIGDVPAPLTKTCSRTAAGLPVVLKSCTVAVAADRESCWGEQVPLQKVPAERYQAGPWPDGEPLHGTGVCVCACVCVCVCCTFLSRTRFLIQN